MKSRSKTFGCQKYGCYVCDSTKEAYIQYACQKELHNTWTKSIEIEKNPVNDYCIKILCQEFFYISSDSNSNRRLLITL